MRKFIAAAIILLVISGCVSYPGGGGGGQVDRYALFSYLPPEGAKGAVFIDMKESAFSEATTLLGTIISGKIKDIRGMQIAILSYEDGSSAGIVQMDTNLSIYDAIAGIPNYFTSYYAVPVSLESPYIGSSSSESSFTNETKEIGGRNVTLIYSRYDSTKDNPVCAWRDGNFLNVLYYQKSYSSSYPECIFPAGLSCTSYDIDGSGKLHLMLGQGTGHSIKINSILCTSSSDYNAYQNVNIPLANPVMLVSGSKADIAGGGSSNSVMCNGLGSGIFSGRVYVNYTEMDTGLNRIAAGSLVVPIGGNVTKKKRCDTILENTYDDKKATELLAESAGMAGSFTTSANVFGEGMAYNGSRSTDVKIFGDDAADYVVIINNGEASGSNLCYGTYGNSKGEIVSMNGKQACILNNSGGMPYYSYPFSSAQLITIQRKSDNYSATLIAYTKDSSEIAISRAEDAIFSINLPGEEQNWTDKMSIRVKVYENQEEGMVRQPVADAKVELYNQSYIYPLTPPVSSNGVRTMEPIETAYTDDNGIASFNNLDIGSYTITASKSGYSKGNAYVYPGGSMNTSIILQPIQPLVVTVMESTSYTGWGYGGSPIAGAEVDLYNNSGGEYTPYGSQYTFVKTLYTDDNGVANFGKVNVDYGKIEVSKEGYINDTGYISAYSGNVTAYISKLQEKENYGSYYNYSGEPFTVNVETYGTARMYEIADAKVEIYNLTKSNQTVLVGTNYTDSDGIAHLSGSGVENGMIKVSKSGYSNYSQYFFSYNTRNMMVYLSRVATVGVTEIGMVTPIAQARIDVYTGRGSFSNVETLYTDEAGWADFSNITQSYDGKAEISKDGYYNRTFVFYKGSGLGIVELVRIQGNATKDYPIIKVGGGGCINPSKDEAPTEWVVGPPDGKMGCFWENWAVYGTFGKTLNFSNLNITLQANEISVNKSIRVLTSNSEYCYDEIMNANFSTYTTYAEFIPDSTDVKDYVVSNGMISARCIALEDLTRDGYGYYIDAIGVR